MKWKCKFKLQKRLFALLLSVVPFAFFLNKSSDDEDKFFRLVSLTEYEGEMYNPKDYFDADDTLGNPINTPALAAQIGVAYLRDIYGDEVINGEYPFEVVKFKHSWLMIGTLPKEYCGGTGSITISSKGGMVRYFCHEK